ncbi:MAG TPA: hypothetical protein VK524_02425, partial [Polyangiaceae bacterium]|nr:hypothetical protein [Polyangiaceae bacterium]
GAGRYLGLWNEPLHGELTAHVLDAKGAILENQVVLRDVAAPLEGWPYVTWNGCSYLAAWREVIPDRLGVIDFNGEFVGPDAQYSMNGTLVAPLGSAPQNSPLVFNRQRWEYARYGRMLTVSSASGSLLVWTQHIQGSPIYAQRVARNGEILDANPVQLTTANVTEFAAASLGTDYLIPYGDFSAESAFDVSALLVRAGGDVTPLTITKSMGSQLRPAIASNASGYFAVWYDLRAGSEIWGVPLNEAGSPAGPEVRIGAAASFWHEPRIASDGDGYLVAWTNPAEQAVLVKIDARGNTSNTPVALSENDQVNTVLFDGSVFIVRGQQTRLVSRAGALLPNPPAIEQLSELYPLASDGRGHTLFGTVRQDTATGKIARRIWARMLTAPHASSPAVCGDSP